MPIRAGHGERQRVATRIDQQVSLAAVFSPDRSGSPRPLSVPMASSSLPHQCFANARQCRATRHTRPVQLATTIKKNRRAPIPESAHEWHWHYRIALSVKPPIGSPCAAHTQCLRTPNVPLFLGGLRLAYEYIACPLPQAAAVPTVVFVSRIHPTILKTVSC